MTWAARIGAAAALAVLAGTAVGCGGGATSSHAARKAVDPYKAALAFAQCMREHGVPHPNPDRAGNFHLTPHDEELMRKVSRRKHELAEEACFHHLKGAVSTKPLSAHAKALAVKALDEFSACMRKRGWRGPEKMWIKGEVVRGFARTVEAPRVTALPLRVADD